MNVRTAHDRDCVGSALGRATVRAEARLFVNQANGLQDGRSPLAQGRGSKHMPRSPTTRHDRVAPRAGRGSKPCQPIRRRPAARSRPSRGAWIETSTDPGRNRTNPRSPLARGVDRNDASSAARQCGYGSPLAQGRGSKRETSGLRPDGPQTRGSGFARAFNVGGTMIALPLKARPQTALARHPHPALRATFSRKREKGSCFDRLSMRGRRGIGARISCRHLESVYDS